MSVHIHTTRSYCAGALGLILAAVLLGWVYAPRVSKIELGVVIGRATCGGCPIAGTWVVFQTPDSRAYMACGLVHADGSFRMQPWDNFDGEGLATGTYRVYILTGNSPSAPRYPIDARYRAPETSDLLVHVGPAWNDVVLSLPDAGRGPTLAQHP